MDARFIWLVNTLVKVVRCSHSYWRTVPKTRYSAAPQLSVVTIQRQQASSHAMCCASQKSYASSSPCMGTRVGDGFKGMLSWVPVLAASQDSNFPCGDGPPLWTALTGDGDGARLGPWSLLDGTWINIGAAPGWNLPRRVTMPKITRSSRFYRKKK